MTSSTSELLNRELPHTLDWISRFRLTAAVVVCYAIFWWLCAWVGLPAVPKMGGSLLSEPQPSIAIGIVAAGIIICTVVGKIIVGNLEIGPDMHFEGALLAAVVGMMAVVFRIGPVRYALFAMDDRTAFLLLAVELVLIYVIVAFCWMALQWAAPVAAAGTTEPLATKFGATATHAVVMAACMIFLAQSDDTAQALVAVAVSALLASMAAHIAFPVRCSAWYWASPVIVGVLGYFIAFINPAGLRIGYPEGLLGALARPTPLAYACGGPAGAIFGFWTAYRWHHEQSAQAS
jgi:hypothetical protein